MCTMDGTGEQTSGTGIERRGSDCDALHHITSRLSALHCTALLVHSGRPTHAHDIYTSKHCTGGIKSVCARVPTRRNLWPRRHGSFLRSMTFLRRRFRPTARHSRVQSIGELEENEPDKTIQLASIYRPSRLHAIILQTARERHARISGRSRAC